LALTKSEKEKIVADYVERFSKSQALIVTDYRGLTVSDFNRIRAQMRESGNAFLVVKNTLAKIALEQAGRSAPSDLLAGTVAIGICYDDIAGGVKALNAFAQETKILNVKGAILGARVVGPEAAKSLADLPSREVLLAQVVGGLQAPISGLVNVMAGPIRGLLTVLKARADQLEPAS